MCNTLAFFICKCLVKMSFYTLALGKEVNIGGMGTFWSVNVCENIVKLQQTLIPSIPVVIDDKHLFRLGHMTFGVICQQQ